jgi:hypothetical protein
MKETVYSFSRTNYTCLADFHQHYIQEKEGGDNAWGFRGGWLHELVEEVAKGNLTQKEALGIFENEWFTCTEIMFPATSNWPDPEQSYYDNVLPWFKREVWWNHPIVSIEEHLHFELPSGRKFQGLKDLTLQRPDGKELLDYKFAKPYEGDDLENKIRQLYIYAWGEKQVNGEYPKYLTFDWFQKERTKNKKRITTEPYTEVFDEDKMFRVLDWAEARINDLEGRITANKRLGVKGLFLPDYDELLDKRGYRNYYCMNICNFRENCSLTNGNTLKIFEATKLQDIEIKN